MVKQKCIWFFGVLNMFVCLCSAMDGQPPQQKLTLRVPGFLVQAVQGRSVAAGVPPAIDFLASPIPPPPLPYPVFDNDDDEKRIPASFRIPGSMDPNDDDLELPELGNMDEAFEEWLDEIATTPLYLVRFDAPRLRYLTFCECSRKRLISKYLTYLLSDSTTAEYTTIRSLSVKIPSERIKQEGLLYTLLCSAQHCGHIESQLSVEELTVRMILHHMIEHQKTSTWYQQIEGQIKPSFEDALAVIKDESE